MWRVRTTFPINILLNEENVREPFERASKRCAERPVNANWLNLEPQDSAVSSIKIDWMQIGNSSANLRSLKAFLNFPGSRDW